MKKIITFLLFIFLLLLVGFTYTYKETILETYYKVFYNNKVEEKINLDNKNEYYRDYDFLFVQNTDNFKPTNRQDILNIFYSVINSGYKEFSFYCPKEYEGCIDEVKSIAKDQVTLSNINNYVHPFNSFKGISTQTDDSLKVKITVTKAYTDTEINTIKQTIKTIENEILDKDLNSLDQLKTIHDYIINNSIYDSNRTDNNVIEYKSDIAYGPLIEGYGICGGYSDAFSLFLEDLNIKNYKVSSDSHVWNAVYLYGNWYNFDLTWDDPITDTKEQILSDEFFKLTTDELQTKEPTQHIFDKNVYKELA